MTKATITTNKNESWFELLNDAFNDQGLITINEGFFNVVTIHINKDSTYTFELYERES